MFFLDLYFGVEWNEYENRVIMHRGLFETVVMLASSDGRNLEIMKYLRAFPTSRKNGRARGGEAISKMAAVPCLLAPYFCVLASPAAPLFMHLAPIAPRSQKCTRFLFRAPRPRRRELKRNEFESRAVETRAHFNWTALFLRGSNETDVAL